VATPTIREVLHGAASAPITHTTGAGTAVDDVLVCFHGSDWYQATSMGAPTGTAGTWTQRGGNNADLGTNNSHMKIWTRPVTVGGAQTVTCSQISDEDIWSTLYVLTGADTASPSDDAATFAQLSGSTSQTAPSVSPTSTDALLICCVLSEVFRVLTYTPPSGMTERSEDSNSSTMTTATVGLTASGATGTKTFTASSGFGWVSGSIAIKAPAATFVRPTIVTPRTAVVRAGSW
jgi:hypothetical protein